MTDRTISGTYEISGTKAILGSVLIEYVFYAVLYLIEGAKYSEYNDDSPSIP